MKLTATHIKQIRACLNRNWRGYRKEVAQRVYDNGDISLNDDLHPDQGQDLHDLFPIDQARGYELELRNGGAVLDIWLYRGEWLVDQRPVYVRHVTGNHLLVSVDYIEDGDVLREAVRLAVED